MILVFGRAFLENNPRFLETIIRLLKAWRRWGSWIGGGGGGVRCLLENVRGSSSGTPECTCCYKPRRF